MSKGKGIGQLKHFVNQFSLEDAGLPKPVKDLLAKCNDYVVDSITISRNPVQFAIQGILKTVSTVPYDDLFHLFMVFNWWTRYKGKAWLADHGGFIEQRCSQESKFGPIAIFMLIHRLHEHLLKRTYGKRHWR